MGPDENLNTNQNQDPKIYLVSQGKLGVYLERDKDGIKEDKCI